MFSNILKFWNKNEFSPLKCFTFGKSINFLVLFYFQNNVHQRRRKIRMRKRRKEKKRNNETLNNSTSGM
jgi:hypothetical protein